MVLSLLSAIELNEATVVPLSIVGAIVIAAIVADRRLGRVESTLVAIKDLLEQTWTIDHQQIWTAETKARNKDLHLPDPLKIKRRRPQDEAGND